MHTNTTRHCRKCDRHLTALDFDTFVEKTGKNAGCISRFTYCQECRTRLQEERESSKILPENTTVFCACGCGELTPVSKKTMVPRGTKRGEPQRFVLGHSGRIVGPKYIVDPETGCWVWQRARNVFGYGICQEGLAHRVIYEAQRERIPDGYVLHHHCQNRGCVNPEHMEPQERGFHVRQHKTSAARGSDGRFIHSRSATSTASPCSLSNRSRSE